MKTREATETDLPQWAALRHALWQDHAASALQAEARCLLDSADQACFLLVNDAGRSVGFAEVALHSGPEGPYAHLEGWYVDPDYRGKGYGRELVGAVEQWCLHRSICLLTSDTEPSFPLSPTAHARAGFTKICSFTIFAKRL